MKKIIFKNLIEANPKSKNFGKPVEIEVPDDFDEHACSKSREYGCELGDRFADDIAGNSGRKIKMAFGNDKRTIH